MPEASDTGGTRLRLNAAEVAELAEPLEGAPRRARVVDEVLQAAAERRGMKLVLFDRGSPPVPPATARAPGGEVDPVLKPAQQP